MIWLKAKLWLNIYIIAKSERIIGEERKHFFDVATCIEGPICGETGSVRLKLRSNLEGGKRTIFSHNVMETES